MVAGAGAGHPQSDLTAMGRGEVAGILPGILAGMRGRGQETGYGS